MNPWSVRQLLALFIAVFVTVGMSLSVVQASNMTLKMAMTSDMGVTGHSDCHGCPIGSDKGMKSTGCTAICVAPVLAMLRQTETPVSAPEAGPLLPLRYSQPDDAASAPDPYPPRPISIG